jgi:ABC-type phosphate/phosphonate transport system permease subunit
MADPSWTTTNLTSIGWLSNTMPSSITSTSNRRDRSEMNPCHRRPIRRALLVAQVLLAVVTGSLTVRDWSVKHGQMWIMFAALFAATTTTFAFGGGWLVPCTVCGTLAGIFFDPSLAPGSGTVESRMWSTVTSVSAGTVAGLVVGFVIDTASASSIMDNDDASKTDTD